MNIYARLLDQLYAAMLGPTVQSLKLENDDQSMKFVQLFPNDLKLTVPPGDSLDMFLIAFLV